MRSSTKQFDKAALSEQLAQGLGQLKLSVEADKQTMLLAYLEQLDKWNQAYNLSGIKDPGRMVPLHLLDSLAVLPFIHANKVLDVGTGAGLPGLPLAICLPELNVSLLDSNGKKIRFLFQTCALLKITNVDFIQERVESYQSMVAFDIVLSRAFSSLKQFVEQSRHLLAEDGRLLAMKGQYPQTEVQEIPKDFELLDVHELIIPGESGSRHLLELARR